MVENCAMCRGGATRGSLELPAEALNLMLGGSEMNIDEVSGPIHISFCEVHWDECRELVLERDINPIIRCIADEAYYTEVEDEWGEKHSERKETEIVGKARRAAQNSWSSQFGMSEVASKIILWTLDAIYDAVHERQSRLAQDLTSELRQRGYSAMHLPSSESADVLASYRSEQGTVTFGFSVLGLDRSHPNVDYMVDEEHYKLDLMNELSPLRSQAEGFGAYPLVAIRWYDDPRWFLYYDRFGDKYATGDEYITLERPVERIPRLLEEDTFTPLPTLDDLPDVLKDEDRWEKAINRRRLQEAAPSDHLKDLIGLFR